MKGRPDRAFTLLEMLVATTMVVVLAGSLYASLYTAFKARRTALSACEEVRKVNAAMEIIQADLLSAVIPNGVLASEFMGQSGQGNIDPELALLSFYASTTDVQAGPGVGDVKRVEYSIENSPDLREMVLVRRVTANLLAPQDTGGRAEVVCRGVRAMVMRYFDGQTWQEEWDSTAQENTLPTAVEVTLVLDSPSRPNGLTACRIVLVPCGQDIEQRSTTGTTGGTGGASAGGKP